MDGLRRLRRERGLTQQELADAAGMTQHTVSELELGRQEPRPSTLKKLARGLGVEVPELFGVEPGESPKARAQRLIPYDPEKIRGREAHQRELEKFSPEELREIRDGLEEALEDILQVIGTRDEIRKPANAEAAMARIDLLEAQLAVTRQLQAVADRDYA